MVSAQPKPPPAPDDSSTVAPAKLAFSYSHEDIDLLIKLRKHLTPLVRAGKIERWDDSQLRPGTTWNSEIEEQFRQADLILLLVSSDSLSSDYIQDKEMPIAQQKQSDHRYKVIPIIVRACPWSDTILGQWQALPLDTKRQCVPVEEWPHQDKAWVQVADAVKHWVDSRQIGEVPNIIPDPPTVIDAGEPSAHEAMPGGSSPEIEEHAISVMGEGAGAGTAVPTDPLEGPNEASVAVMQDAAQEWLLRVYPGAGLYVAPPSARAVNFINFLKTGKRLDVVVEPLAEDFRTTFRGSGRMATTPRYPPADVTMYLFVATSLEDAVTAKSLLKRKLQPFPGTAAVVGFLDRTGLFVDIWQVEASDVSRVLEELPR